MRWQERAVRQGGVVDVRQLRADGVTGSRLRGMVGRGELVRVLPGVYRAAASPVTRHGARWAAVSWSGGWISHTSAAEMWQLPLAPSGTVHVSVPDRMSRGGQRAFVRLHRVLTTPADQVVLDGLPVTGRRRTLLDLIGWLPPDRARDLLGRSLQSGWIGLADLDARLRDEQGRTGNVQLRRLRAEADPAAHAALERRFHALLRAHGITGWVAQYALPTRAGGSVHVDVAFPAARLVVELDGYLYHRDRSRFEGDRYRDRRSLVDGWRTVRVTSRQLEEHPDEVVADLLALLAVAA